ncbi:hypothetical protein [Terriglobus sp.]|uniref:hypothetical protein n=1 Tax=Terriglobus sp. TaxID=1889013 RepID=UPI003B00B5FE
MPFRIARSLAQILISLSFAIPLGMGLVWSRSGLARAGDATLDSVGDLISQHLRFPLERLDPTYLESTEP